MIAATALTRISRRNIVKAGVGAAVGTTALHLGARRAPAIIRRRGEVNLTSPPSRHAFGPEYIAEHPGAVRGREPGYQGRAIELPRPINSTEVHTYLVNSLNARNGEPDVFTQDCIWIPEFGGAGLALPLDDFVTDRRQGRSTSRA